MINDSCRPSRNARTNVSGMSFSEKEPALPPVSRILMMSCLNVEFSAVSGFCAANLVTPSTRWALTIAPSAATPTTAPSWRAVLVAEAATPECRAGMWLSTAEVSGTTVMPKPRPASARASASSAKLNDAPSPTSTRASSMPAAATAQPTTMGGRDPLLATHGPAARPPSTMAAAIGANMPANFQPE